MSVIPANPNFDVLYIANNDDGYTAEPIVAWSIDDDNRADPPQAITATGILNGSDVAIRYPSGMVLYNGRHHKEISQWRYAVERREDR